MNLELTKPEVEQMIRKHFELTMPELLKGKHIASIDVGSRYDTILLKVNFEDQSLNSESAA